MLARWVVAMLSICLTQLVLAAPPLERAANYRMNTSGSNASRNNASGNNAAGSSLARDGGAREGLEHESRFTVETAKAMASNLDLRLPREARFGASADNSERTLFQRRLTTESGDPRLRDLGAAYDDGTKAESMQAMVQRVRREGVPVARLWESKSALVSLGLNGRGKPGIWLVQKIH